MLDENIYLYYNRKKKNLLTKHLKIMRGPILKNCSKKRCSYPMQMKKQNHRNGKKDHKNKKFLKR